MFANQNLSQALTKLYILNSSIHRWEHIMDLSEQIHDKPLHYLDHAEYKIRIY
jgi:hypothetical protein